MPHNAHTNAVQTQLRAVVTDHPAVLHQAFLFTEFQKIQQLMVPQENKNFRLILKSNHNYSYYSTFKTKT